MHKFVKLAVADDWLLAFSSCILLSSWNYSRTHNYHCHVYPDGSYRFKVCGSLCLIAEVIMYGYISTFMCQYNFSFVIIDLVLNKCSLITGG